MDLDFLAYAAPAVGVTLGLAIHAARQRRLAETLGTTVRSALAEHGTLTLPELVVRAGMKDGFFSRGKMMNALMPMVAAGELVQEEPPGTTIKNRLSVLRFRLPGGETSGLR